MANLGTQTNYTLVSGTESDDSIQSYGGSSWYNSTDKVTDVTINAKGGNDYIGSRGNYCIIYGGDGHDTIFNDGNNNTIIAGDGNDSINFTTGEYLLIEGGAGRDTISYNKGAYTSSSAACTISGGAGNDLISIRGSASSTRNQNRVILYNDGDGDDTIWGFNGTDTLSISGSSYSTTESGSDVIVYVSNGSIILKEAATLPSINIVEAVSWKLNGMTATYGTSSNALITVNGVKSLDGISLSGSVVTIANSALNNSKVTISDGYTLKLASDVTAPSYTAESWQLSGTTAIYKGASNTAGYTVNNNQIVYTAAKSGDTFTVSGVKSTSGLSVSGNVVTVANSSLNSSNVTISDSNYKLALANDAPTPTTAAASWSYANNVATYKAASTSSGYKLVNNQIVYSAASGGNTLFTVSGVKSSNGLSLSGNVVTVGNAALNSSNVTISNSDYKLALTNSAPTPTTTAAASWSYANNVATYKAASTSSGYKLVNNQIVYTAASGGDTLFMVSGVKSSNGLSLSGNVVTVGTSALNSSNVTISNSNYKLALANGVPTPTTTAASWSYANNVATYKAASTSSGYNLVNNQIVYSAASGGNTLVTVSGVKSANGLSVSGNVVTVETSALNSSNVTISNSNYKLALANGVPAPTTTAASWSYANNVATYKTAATSSGYKVVNNQIVYSAASGGDSFTISGVKSSEGLSVSGNAVTVGNAALNGSNVTISNSNYKLALANGVSAPTTTAASWSYANNVATYKAASTSSGYTLKNNQIVYSAASGGDTFTVSGVKSTSGLVVDTTNKKVTVGNASLNSMNVTISNGWTLARANGVPYPKPIEAGWSLNGTTAKYKAAATSSGYKLVSNQIVYSAASSGEDLVTINGVKSTNGLTLDTDNKAVNVSSSASLNTDKVTVSSDEYSFEFATNYKNATISGSKYDETIKTAGQYVTINGGAGEDSISVSGKYTSINGGSGDNYVAIGANASNSTVQTGNDKDTISNKAKNALIDSKGGNDYIINEGAHAKINSGAGDDTISNSGSNVTINSGEGNDSIVSTGSKVTIKGGKGDDIIWLGENSTNNFIEYKSGDGNDTIADYSDEDGDIIKFTSAGTPTFSIKDNNVIVKFGKGKITLLNAKGKVITYMDKDGGLHTWSEFVKFNGEGTDATAVSLKVAFNKDSFNINDYGEDYAGVKIINASKVEYPLTITGNKINNKIIGGSGNDTLIGGKGNDSLTGGAGADVFVWNKGDNNDTILDYTEEDTIQIKSDTVKSIKPLTKTPKDIVISLTSGGKITVKGGADKVISYIDTKGNHFYPIIVNEAGTAVTLPSEYSGDVFNVADYEFADTARTIDASAVDHDLTITGNKKNNKIIGGLGNDSLIGGRGNDSLKGGKGSDVFVYSSGDGNDVITNYTEGEDKIKITSGTAKVKTSGKNVIFTVGTGKISVKGASEKIIAYTDAEGNDSYYLKTVTIDGKNDTLGATLATNYFKDSFDSADYDNAVRVIDASNVSKALTIKGSSKADKIYGGDGDDTIIGGRGDDSLQGNNGKDTFVYASGDGKDVILDYEEEDTLQIKSGTIKSITTEGNDVVFKIGSGSITVKNGKGTEITYIDANSKPTTRKADTTTAKLDDSYWFTNDDKDFNTARLDSIIKTTSAAYSFGELDISTPLTTDKTLITYSGKK